MAHFAKISDDNSVVEIIVVANEDCGGGNFPESEPIGQDFIASLGLTGRWLQCSYHGNFRGRYPRMFYLYDEELDEFVEQEIPSP